MNVSETVSSIKCYTFLQRYVECIMVFSIIHVSFSCFWSSRNSRKNKKKKMGSKVHNRNGRWWWTKEYTKIVDLLNRCRLEKYPRNRTLNLKHTYIQAYQKLNRMHIEEKSRSYSVEGIKYSKTFNIQENNVR